jgi:hypothetical protein
MTASMVTMLGLLPSAGAELRHAHHIARKGPLRVERRKAQLGVKHDDPEAAADRQRLVLRRLDQECPSSAPVFPAFSPRGHWLGSNR